MQSPPIGTWLGNASLAAGLLMTVLNLVFYFRLVGKQRRETAKLDVDIESQQRQLAALRPRFSAFYVEVSEEGWGDLRAEVESRGGFWRFPTLQNDVHRTSMGATEDWSAPPTCRDDEMDRTVRTGAATPGGRTAVFLVVEQTGKSRATDVRLATKTLRLSADRCIEIYEADDLNLWADEQIDLGGNVALDELRLGDLDTGQGVLVPLFVRTHFYASAGTWTFALSRGPVVIPLHLTYVDELQNERREFAIRAMLDVPQQLSARVVVRG